MPRGKAGNRPVCRLTFVAYRRPDGSYVAAGRVEARGTVLFDRRCNPQPLEWLALDDLARLLAEAGEQVGATAFEKSLPAAWNSDTAASKTAAGRPASIDTGAGRRASPDGLGPYPVYHEDNRP